MAKTTIPKTKTVFVCIECGNETSKWFGRCPSCNKFNTMEEQVTEQRKSTAPPSGGLARPVLLRDIQSMAEDRLPTNMDELDRVLSGGIVSGSLTLVGGDPGIGKSTLLLQLCRNICTNVTGVTDSAGGKRVLYVSGEESASQIKLRAERLSISTDNLYILAETNMYAIENALKELRPDLAIIDSIQTVFKDELTSTQGSVTQVRECTQTLMQLAKGLNISIFIVGHVTKEGAIAGPRVLEHMVDTVLYFEGERRESYRIIRAVKNRFGATNEIGVFEMREQGLMEISNPSEYMLSGRPLGVSGSAITCSIEGTRPILTEVQALVSYTSFQMPRRTATGMDYNRVVMLIAVLEKRAGMIMANYDSYVNIAGGIKILEPSLDAAVISAIASSYKNKPIDPYTIVFGEVGLTGELRAVSLAEKRITEAHKLGFKNCIVPQANLKGLRAFDGMRIFGAANVGELLSLALEAY